MFSTLNGAVTLYTSSVAASLQLRETMMRKLKKKMRLSFPQAKGPQTTFPHVRKMDAHMIQQDQYLSPHLVQ